MLITSRLRLMIHVLATYALWLVNWATPAQGDPVSASILAAMGYANAAGLLAPTAVLGSLLWNGVVAALPTILLNAAIGVGLTLMANANRPQPQATDPGARIVNFRQDIADRTKSYGLNRGGGPVGFWKARNGQRLVAVLVNSGEINAVVAQFLDETEITLDETGQVTTAKFRTTGNGPVIQIETFLGAPEQPASTMLLGNFPGEWTTDHTFAGIAGGVIAFANPPPDDFARIYPGGRELTWSMLYEGSKVYDPRDPDQVLGDPSTYKYRSNAALVMADWIVNETDGLGGEVDWGQVADEADASDVVVLDRNGVSLPKWQLCGTYSFNQTRGAVREAMALACDAFFYERGDGKVGFRVGRWLEPSVTIRDRHILSIKITEGQDGTDRPNAMVGLYTEAGAGYRRAPSSAYVLANGESYSEDVFEVYWSPEHNQTVRVCKRVLRAKRAQYDVQATLKLYGLMLQEERFFRLELDELGLSFPVEISSWAFAEDGLTILVSGKSLTGPSDFAFEAATEEPAQSQIGDIVIDDAIEDPENVQTDSPEVGLMRVSFDPPPRGSLLKRVRYRLVGETDWSEVGVPNSQNFIIITGLPSGADFEPQVQFRTAIGTGSDWVAATPTTIEIN